MASGLPNMNPLNAGNIVKSGLQMVRSIRQFREKSNGENDMLEVRIGIHSCSNVTAAVVG